MTIFGQFFEYFSAPRIKSGNPLGDVISITINSMSLKFGASRVIPVLLRRVAIDFSSSSPSIMGPSVFILLLSLKGAVLVNYLS